MIGMDTLHIQVGVSNHDVLSISVGRQTTQPCDRKIRSVELRAIPRLWPSLVRFDVIQDHLWSIRQWFANRKRDPVVQTPGCSYNCDDAEGEQGLCRHDKAIVQRFEERHALFICFLTFTLIFEPDDKTQPILGQ